MKQRTGKSGDSAKSKKKYYLWDVMQFLLPFTKSRLQSGNLPIENNEDEMFDTDQASIDDDENDSRATGFEQHAPDEHPEPNVLDTSNFSRTPSRTSSRSSTKKKTPLQPPVDEMEHAVVNYLSQRSAPIPENPDLDFFKSILPDVASLNASEKRMFKVRMLQTLDDMLQKKSTPVNDKEASNSQYTSDVLASNTSNIHAGNFIPSPFGESMFVNEGNYPPNYQRGYDAPDQNEPSSR